MTGIPKCPNNWHIGARKFWTNDLFWNLWFIRIDIYGWQENRSFIQLQQVNQHVLCQALPSLFHQDQHKFWVFNCRKHNNRQKAKAWWTGKKPKHGASFVWSKGSNKLYRHILKSEPISVNLHFIWKIPPGQKYSTRSRGPSTKSGVPPASQGYYPHGESWVHNHGYIVYFSVLWVIIFLLQCLVR